MFSPDGSYREAPFDEPLTGPDAVRAHWSNLPKAGGDIAFGYEILAVSDPWGIAHWHGSYTRVEDGTQVELDGILMVSLDEDGRCRDFREWSVIRPRAFGV